MGGTTTSTAAFFTVRKAVLPAGFAPIKSAVFPPGRAAPGRPVPTRPLRTGPPRTISYDGNPHLDAASAGPQAQGCRVTAPEMNHCTNVAAR